MSETAKTRRLTYVTENDSVIRKLLVNLLENLSGRPRIQRLYDEIQQMDYETHQAWSIALDKLEITRDFDPDKLLKIKGNTPLVIIANHPFGVVDGLIMGEIGSLVRDHFSILTNSALCTLDPRINDYLLPIDFDETKNAMATNIETRKKAIERLKRGEGLIIFPSGGVATAKTPFGPAEDLEWKRFVVKLITMAKADVLPVFFHGKNSRLFQIATNIHETLRMGLLLHEARNKMGKKIKVSIGEVIPFSDLQNIKNKQVLLDKLKEITFSYRAPNRKSNWRLKRESPKLKSPQPEPKTTG